MKASLKLTQIESKISKLEAQKQRLLEERQKEIVALIAVLDLASLENKILVGGLQFLKHKITTNDPLVEGWHSAGERFFRHTKRNKKFQSSKKAPYPQSVHQSSQKSSQSRENKNENQKPV